MTNAGIAVIQKEKLSQFLAVVDKKILWYESINFLEFCEEEDYSIRLCDTKISAEVEGEMFFLRGGSPEKVYFIPVFSPEKM